MTLTCLGIECTAHTFGVGMVDETGRIISNEKVSFTSTGRGMVPREVVEFHKTHREAVLKKALVEKPDLVAVSQGPGIGTMLSEGIVFARALSERFEVPLIGVNHAVAHFEIGIQKCQIHEPVVLYVSGGNTQVLVLEKKERSKADEEKIQKSKSIYGAAPEAVHAEKIHSNPQAVGSSRYRVVGETLDIGLGNLLDKAARHLGLGFPGGPPLYELSLKGGKTFVPLPYNVKGMDVCFSGLYTDFIRKADGGKEKPQDLAFSLQEVAFDMVCEVAERALSQFEKDELLLAGGVACSKILQEKAKIMCEERGAKMFVPDNAFLVDNGAMIAWNGIQSLLCGAPSLTAHAKPMPHWRADAVDVTWR